MAQFKVYTNEKITLWQRVGLVIEADSAEQAREILNDAARFQALMYDGGGEYTGDVDPYWETEDHAGWDHDAPTITPIPESEGNYDNN
jgi:hypothetical protein